jgi:hypothetical protein
MRHQGRITKWRDDQGFGFFTRMVVETKSSFISNHLETDYEDPSETKS